MAEQETVAFLGPRASYTHQAALDSFDETKYSFQPVVNIEDVFAAVQASSADYGVVPIENSSNGAVIFTLDLFADLKDRYPDILICGEAYVRIEHCLLGFAPPPKAATHFVIDETFSSSSSTSPTTFSSSSSASATPPSTSGVATPTPDAPAPSHPRTRPLADLTGVKKLYSHPQAWGQCKNFLNAHLRGVERQDCSSTSRAAEQAARDPTGASAAVSSATAAKLHGLDFLAKGINDRDDNTTRFFVLRRRAGCESESEMEEGEGGATTALIPPANATAPALPPASPRLELPPAHHLVYFNPVIPAHQLLPDGTDPLQSPGAPFVRRMWAGGYVRFAGEGRGEGPVVVDGGRWVCVEGIRDVAVKGREGEEKVFVGIERRVGRAVEGEEGDEERVRERLWTEREEEWGGASLVERRNIVFMRGRTPEEAKVEVERARGKMLFPQHPPDFAHTLVPTPSLLFRYSALTFNAHAIHLDPHYCRTVEGHRNLLFHGPLSFSLLATLLQNNLPPGRCIAQLEYRNLAPLYCDEPVKLCGRKADPSPSNGKSGGKGDKYEVWAETPEGGLAVKGTAYVIAA
ncbi:P-protein [Diplodia seriata]|uniref:prephenate dehydratase n=1 Tax=Diplodia seriata TaxID=420778 RepID=A0A1S8BPE7_9PEZI|nr:P-protein [Diplodia seriata]